MKTDVTVKSQWNGKPVKIAAKAVTGKSIFEIGFIVEGQAKLLCPIDQGRLAASITTQAFDHGTSPSGPGAIGSDKIKPPTDENEVLVGTNVVYAAVHEFGGVIRPVKGKFLAIPVGDYKDSPRNHNLAMATTRKGQFILVDPATGKVQYLLRTQVEIPAQPYLRPALDMARGQALTVVEKNGKREFAEYLKK